MAPFQKLLNQGKRRSAVYLSCPSQKTRYRVRRLPQIASRKTPGFVDHQAHVEDENSWIGNNDDHQVDPGQFDISQSSNKATSSKKAKKYSAAETRARFEANWNMVRPAMADVLNDNYAVKCQHTSGQCREMQWTLLTVGKSEGRMREFGETKLCYRSCQELAAVIVEAGYFPSAPKRPSLAFSLDWLELFHSIFMLGALSKYAFVQGVTRFLEMRTFDRLPLCSKSFEYSYFNWLTTRELAERRLWDTIPGSKSSNAVIGTLQHQCVCCHWRVEFQPPDPLTSTSAEQSDPAGDAIEIEYPCPANDPVPNTRSVALSKYLALRLPSKSNEELAQENVYYTSGDGNLSHRRFAQKSQGQLVQTWGSTFVNTYELRIPISSKVGKALEWGTVESRPAWERRRSNHSFHPQPQRPALVGNLSPGNLYQPPQANFRRQTTSQASDLIPHFTTTSPNLPHAIYMVSADHNGCPHAFAADKGNKSEVHKHEKPPSMRCFDETGLVAFVCRHGIPLRMGDLWRGENFETVWMTWRSIIDELPKQAKVFLQYDLACKFENYIKRDPELAERLSSGKIVTSLNAFHVYSHQLSCQLKYGPLQIVGLGRTCGESVERNWASKMQLIPIGRISSAIHRHQAEHAHNLQIAKTRRAQMPYHLARRRKRLLQEITEAEDSLRKAGQPWIQKTAGKTLIDYQSHLCSTMQLNKNLYLRAEQFAMSIMENAHDHYPHRSIFRELCRLQGQNDFLKPNGIWRPIREWHLQRGDSALRPLIASGMLILEDWAHKKPLWQQYMAEVCLVRLYQLRNEISSEVSARKMEFHQVTWKFQGQKESKKLYGSINKRGTRIPTLVNNYNEFLYWMVSECPNAFEPDTITNFHVTVDNFNPKELEESESEGIWNYHAKFLRFWDTSCDWEWECEQLKHAHLALKITRSQEDLKIMKIEMESLGCYLLQQFDLVTDPLSPLRKGRNWQDYMNNTMDAAKGFIINAKAFDLELLGECLSDLWKEAGKGFLPSLDQSTLERRTKQPRQPPATSERFVTLMAKHEREARQITSAQDSDLCYSLQFNANPHVSNELPASQVNNGLLQVTRCHGTNFSEYKNPFLLPKLWEDLIIEESGSEGSNPDEVEDEAGFTAESAREGVDPEDLDQMLNKIDLFGKDEVDDFGDTFGSRIFGI